MMKSFSFQQESSRRDMVVRRERKEVERKMFEYENRLKRRRDRSRDRIDGKRSRRKDKKKEEQLQEAIVVSEEEDEEDSPREVEDEEVEEEEDDENEEADTASEHSGITPEHNEEDSDETAEDSAEESDEGSSNEEDEEESETAEEEESPPSVVDLKIKKDEEWLGKKSSSSNKNYHDEEDVKDEEMVSQGEDEEDDQKQEEEEEEEEEEEDLPNYLPSIYGCRSAEEFQYLNRIEEGTFGIVYRARDKRTSEIVAMKRLKMEREKEGFPITSLREINTLLIAQHPNVVTVREIVVGSNMDKIFIVMDFVEHDLKSLMETMREKKQSFLSGEVKCLMIQLLKAISHLHDNWILHRDLKSSNLLLSHNGILKVGDFGLAREYGSPLKPYTAIVVTLWYRAPELLLGIKEYTTHVDIWSIGCLFGEFLLMEPLFPGKSDIDQLNRIFKLLGTPHEKIWPGYNNLPAVQKMKFGDYPISHLRSQFPSQTLSEHGLYLLKRFFTYDPTKRISCEEALQMEYFRESPLPIDPSMFPTWPAKSEQTPGAPKKAASPKPPSGGGAFKKMNEDEEKLGFNFISRNSTTAAPGWNLKF
uniref:cyclin-dependent kinase n=1 Tax=Lepeophtheirus salmonis TaxID=72036 RepID=A0A0K2V458_LEPSM